MGIGESGPRPGTDALGKLHADLERLPRHQWDNYLWDFCRQFVQRHRRPEGRSEPAGGGPISDSGGAGT